MYGTIESMRMLSTTVILAWTRTWLMSALSRACAWYIDAVVCPPLTIWKSVSSVISWSPSLVLSLADEAVADIPLL